MSNVVRFPVERLRPGKNVVKISDYFKGHDIHEIRFDEIMTLLEEVTGGTMTEYSPNPGKDDESRIREAFSYADKKKT